tara:strand:- start:1210 stop:1650 length:441 start_codon:yes stop_codon:yes gene_type:complete
MIKDSMGNPVGYTHKPVLVPDGKGKPFPKFGETKMDNVMNDVQKYEAIEALFDKAIRPALQGDGGDLELDLVRGNEVIISFQGACGSCPSSSGATLAGIERAIQQNVFPEAVVIPTNDYESRQPTKQEHPFGGQTYEEQIEERKNR